MELSGNACPSIEEQANVDHRELPFVVQGSAPRRRDKAPARRPKAEPRTGGGLIWFLNGKGVRAVGPNTR